MVEYEKGKYVTYTYEEMQDFHEEGVRCSRCGQKSDEHQWVATPNSAIDCEQFVPSGLRKAKETKLEKRPYTFAEMQEFSSDGVYCRRCTQHARTHEWLSTPNDGEQCIQFVPDVPRPGELGPGPYTQHELLISVAKSLERISQQLETSNQIQQKMLYQRHDHHM